MKYNNIEFEAIIATPGCGKSYLCDNYPELFVDVDEERLRLKYVVPENITREELERSKGNRDFKRRFNTEEYIEQLEILLDKKRSESKILIAAPHPESFNYLEKRGIKFCLVYADKSMKEELKRRYLQRGNCEDIANEHYNLFETFFAGNEQDDRPVMKYAFKQNEYLTDIIQKFGIKLQK